MTDTKFLNFPIPMLKGLYLDRAKFCSDAVDVGVFRYSQRLSGNEATCYNDALRFFGITQKNPSTGIRNAKTIISQIPQSNPNAGISVEMLFDFYRNTKSEFELICLGAFLGIRSIIGQKLYYKTFKRMIWARAFGYVSLNDIPAELSSIELKWQTRRRFDRVLRELQLNWGLRIFWDHFRGFYISFDLSLEKLAEIAESNKVKSRAKKLQAERLAIIDGVQLK